MYLKRIDLLGFKSFGKKTELEFQKGITAIVGPNGCGKSNIVDSFRWVLGEQSVKSLRGTKMEDIIFNGTSLRKPLSIAEVSLTFDNECGFIDLDFNEVTITRRIYRSGESEYLVNKRPCRLKDILRLFVDTGIGKEAYSITSQGKIDVLLSTRPEDRRSVFEEAAGIYKYKNRKREAQRRLKETEENILRIGDVVAELEVQILPLGEQARVAREYLALKGELDRLASSLLFADARTHQNKLRRLGERLVTCQEKIADHTGLLTREETRLTSLRWDLEKKTEAVQKMQKQVYDVNEERERVLGQTELMREKIRANESRMEKNREEEDRIREELDKERVLGEDLRQKELVLRQELQGHQEALAKVEEEIRAGEEALGVDQKGALDDMKEKLQEDQYRVEGSIAALEVKKSFTLDRIRMMEQQSEAMILEKYRLNNELSGSFAHKEEKNRAAETLAARIADMKEDRSRLLETLEKGERDLSRLREEARGVMERYTTLKDLDSTYSGYYQGVRNVLQGKKSGRPECKGIHGAVADLIDVKEEYRTAVETALAASLQDLVADDEDSVRKAIGYLKANRLGRATFLPLTVIRGRLMEKERLPGSVMGLAVDLVRCAPRYRQVMNALLGRVLVCRDLETAQKASRELSFRHKIVTLQGEVIYAGGAVTGGSSRKNDTYLLARKQEIETLAGKRETLKGELEILAGKNREVREEEKELARVLGQLEREWQEARDTVSEAARQAENLRAQIDVIAGREKENKKNRNRWEQELKGLTEQEDTLRMELVEIREEGWRVLEKINGLKERLSSGQDTLSALRERSTDLKILRAECQEKLRNVGEKQKEARGEAEVQGCRLNQILEEGKEFRNEGILLQERLKKDETRLASLDRGKGEGVQTLAARKEEEESLKLESMAREEEIKKIRQELQDMKREFSQIEVLKAKGEMEFKGLRDKLAEKYSLHYDSMVEDDVLSMPKGTMRNRIDEIREEITVLGPVNTGSIDEYARIGQRIDYLKEQREDLQAGQLSLQKIIAEIDEKMGQRFMETFEKVNREFNQVFKRLFGGGMAYLELVDREVPLESGIEIIARPPGKKLQMISLLSGGEKALTAISLIFALLRVKPVPFCILDEIDTSLDDTNLERYCRYLREQDEKIQFVLVTHRKQTMQMADILYGVTMEEAGISKIISMKMREKALWEPSA